MCSTSVRISISVPSEVISNCQVSLSVRTVNSISLCQSFSVISVKKNQYLSNFVSQKGECQYFSELHVVVQTVRTQQTCICHDSLEKD